MAKQVLVTLVAAALVAPVPAAAQMDTLTPHLENQRNANIRNHQQRLHEQRTKGPRTTPQGRVTPPQRQTAPHARITPAQRQAAWSRHKAEYRRRLLSGGPASADRWLDQQILAGR